MKLFTLSGVVITFYCVYNAVQAGTSVDSNMSVQSVDTVAMVADIMETAKRLKESLPRKIQRGRRSTSADGDFTGLMEKIGAGTRWLKERNQDHFAYYIQKLFDKSTQQEKHKLDVGINKGAVRPSIVTRQPLLKTLDGPLIQNFRRLLKDNALNTGDIISCRIPEKLSAEHYMMVFNDTHVAEVGVPSGGKPTDKKGFVLLRPFENTSHYDSQQCLYHENVIVKEAIRCDEERERGKAFKKMVLVGEQVDRIIDRLIPTVKELVYSVLSCNCQDLVLYWAYGLVDSRPCIAQFFHDGIITGERSIKDLEHYVKSSCKRFWSYVDI